MNATEAQAELGLMVQERREIKTRLACIKNKLARYQKTLEQTAFSMLVVTDNSTTNARSDPVN